ncbi:MAG: glycosyltransferase family 2 protein [Desulfocapsa sp.]|nr:glycosyltransferase family 2 protein [Desulfocapsa sp.]
MSKFMNPEPTDLIELSFVIPAKDEQDTLEPLALQILSVVGSMGNNYKVKIIFVDDGSTDESWSIMENLADKHQGQIFAIRLRRNFGKAVALEAGFRKSTGNIIFTMDADLQDDPAEIPRFIEALDSGLDLVSGWKKRRHDPASKTLPSRLFNKVTAWTSGVQLHDFNCGYKAYRRKVIESVRLYGELHRYIPVLAHDVGFRIGEIEVQHHPRKHGTSKYGLERYVRGLLDLITVLATTRWLHKPGHLFGGLGVLAGLIGGMTLTYLTTLWFLDIGPIGNRPLLLLGVMLCILSVQLISFGVIGEFFIRIKNPREGTNLITEIAGTDDEAANSTPDAK